MITGLSYVCKMMVKVRGDGIEAKTYRHSDTHTFLWQQQSSAERADRMTVLAINTSSTIIRMRLKLI